MSLAAACLWTLVRTIVLCLMAWPICLLLESWIRRVTDRRRSTALLLLLLPSLFPELMVGYAYRNLALTSTRLAEFLCAGLLFVRIVPIGVVTLLASPRSLADPAAIFCRRLTLSHPARSFRDWKEFCLCYWCGPVRRALPALGLMSLVGFQEFELAALLQAASWTDWFIAAERFGLSRWEMLRRSLWPVLVQAPLLIGIVRWTVQERDVDVDAETTTPTRSWEDSMAVGYLIVALAAGCLYPMFYLGWNLPAGLQMIVRQPTQSLGLLREVGITTAVSLCACLVTWSLTARLASSRPMNRTQQAIRSGLFLFGLAGSLLISLAICALFQQPTLRPLYDSPLPWLLALILWLIPRATLVRLWLDTMTQTEGIFLAKLLNGNRAADPATETPVHGSGHASPMAAKPRSDAASLLFRLRDQPRWLAMCLLFYWAYLDLSTAYLLAPVGMPSGLVRLYNFMHFGRSAALSAEAVLFFGTPLFGMAAGLIIYRLMKRVNPKIGE